MKGLGVASFVVGLVACGLAWPPRQSHVVRFDVPETEVSRGGRLQTFKFSNCLPPSKEMIVVNSVDITPDPLEFPGPINVAFDATVNSTVSSPLKGVVYLAKKVGSVFIKIPCIGQIGSCTYDDVCQLLDQIPECPPSFVSGGFDCKCPFKASHIKVAKTNFEVETSVFPPGDYRGQANLTMNGKMVGCYNIMVTFG